MNDESEKKPELPKKTDRQERQAQALRENLLKRKHQSRDRKTKEEAVEPPPSAND